MSTKAIADNVEVDIAAELEAKRKIYVRNLTVPRGTVFMVLYDINGRAQNVQIPPTPHPFCLSDVVSQFALLEGGNHLRILRTRNILRVIAQAEAEKILSDPTVRAQLDAAVRSTLPVNDDVMKYRGTREKKDDLISAAMGITGFTADGKALAGPVGDHHVNGPILLQSNDPDGGNVNATVRVIVAQFTAGELNSADACDQLSRISDTLSEEDLAYAEGHSHGRFRSYAQELLVRLRTGAVDGASRLNPDVGE